MRTANDSSLSYTPIPILINNNNNKTSNWLDFLIHIHVHVLIFQSKFFKVAPKFGQRSCTIVQGLQPNFIKID